MKKRFKAILGRVAALASALPFAISSLAFPVSADVPYIMTLPASFFSENLPIIQGQYLKSDGTMGNLQFYYRGDMTMRAPDMDTPISLEGLHMYQYQCISTPQDMYISSIAPIIQLDVNLQFSNVTSIYTGYFMWQGSDLNKYDLIDISDLRQYNFAEYYFGGHQTIQGMEPRPSNATKGGYVRFYNDSAYYSGFCDKFTDGLGTTFNFGSCSLSSGATWNGLWIGILAPQINSDYIFDGIVEPEEIPDTPSSNVTGTVSGTASENSSGGYDVDYDISIDVPDYSSRFDDLESAINPSYDSSQLDQMGGDISDYYSAESSLLDAADDGLSSIPDLQLDSELIEDAYNPLQSFFGINIVGIMVFWVGAIAFISYILFGKWV